MSQFRDLDEFLEVEPLELPIRGKVYSFPGEISAQAWLAVQRLGEHIDYVRRERAAGREAEYDDRLMSELDQGRLRAEMFGEAEAEMIADGCTSTHMKIVLFTLIAFHLSGRDEALAVWNARGEATAPSRAIRRSTSKASPTTPTRSRGSRAG